MDAGQLAAVIGSAFALGYGIVRVLPKAFPSDWKPLTAFVLGLAAAVGVGFLVGGKPDAVIASRW